MLKRKYMLLLPINSTTGLLKITTTLNFYYLLEFRETKYRKMAVSQLRRRPGDTAIEIGCGTGLNFKHVRKVIGKSGQLVGIDLTDAMLKQAQIRVQTKGWRNIHLVHSDAAEYAFPAGINGVFSTFALTLGPEFEAVMERASQALFDGGRFVLLDFKRPERWPLGLVKFAVAITRPFGVSLDLAERKPWEFMKTCFRKVAVIDLSAGAFYIAVGEK